MLRLERITIVLIIFKWPRGGDPRQPTSTESEPGSTYEWAEEQSQKVRLRLVASLTDEQEDERYR